MKKIYSMLCLIGGMFLAGVQTSNAQCPVDTSINGIYLFSDQAGNAFDGFLCEGQDSVLTVGALGYYDGDGYIVNLIAGTSVTFRIDSCTGNPVSLTIADSMNTVISGAYSAPACPNSLSFTATYTGSYIVVMNLNGTCAGGGTALIGEVYASIDTGTVAPPCPIQANVINDTICGATQLLIDSGYVSGNTSLAYPSDPLDGFLLSSGYDCSVDLNNVLWYTFTCPTADTALYIRVTSDVGSGFQNTVGVVAADPTNPCDLSTLTYVDCAMGADDVAGLNNVSIKFFAVNPGDVFYLFIDGFNGTTGGFSIAVESSALWLGMENDAFSKKGFSLYPNPANSEISLLNSDISGEVTVQITNSLGQVVDTRNYNNFVKESIDISTMSNGLYSVRVTSSKQSFERKLVIAK